MEIIDFTVLFYSVIFGQNVKYKIIAKEEKKFQGCILLPALKIS